MTLRLHPTHSLPWLLPGPGLFHSRKCHSLSTGLWLVARRCRKRRPSSRDVGGVSWFFWSCGASVGFLTRYDRELREPLVWCQGSQVSIRVARGHTSLLSSHGSGIRAQHNEKGRSRSFSGCSRKPSFPLVPSEKKPLPWDFPPGPVVKTSPSNARGAGSIPGRGAGISHASWLEDQSIKQKQYCNKINKDLAIVRGD